MDWETRETRAGIVIAIGVLILVLVAVSISWAVIDDASASDLACQKIGFSEAAYVEEYGGDVCVRIRGGKIEYAEIPNK